MCPDVRDVGGHRVAPGQPANVRRTPTVLYAIRGRHTVVSTTTERVSTELVGFDPFQPVLLIAVICLVTYRITRLIAADAFPLIAIPREWVIGKLGPDHWFSYLITCMWCASMYVAAGVVAVFHHYVTVPWPYATAFVASAVTGIIATHEPEVD